MYNGQVGLPQNENKTRNEHQNYVFANILNKKNQSARSGNVMLKSKTNEQENVTCLLDYPPKCD